MPKIAESPLLSSYMPDWKEGQREPDRDFLWTVIQHVMPKFGSKLMAEAIRKCASLTAELRARDKPQLHLPMSVVDELLNDPQLHSKFAP